MGSGALNAFTAVIDATAGCPPGDTGLPPALVPVAGVPLLTRTLEACLAAGVRKVLVTIAGSSLDEARRLGRRLAPRLLVEVIPAAPTDPWLAVRNGLNRAALVLPGDLLVEAALLERLQNGPLPDGGAILAVQRGEAGLAALEAATPPPPAPAAAEGSATSAPGVLAGGVRVHAERVTAVGLGAEAANGRATGVWIGTAGLLDAVAQARLDGRAAPLDAVLREAAADGRLGWAPSGPEPAPVPITAADVRGTEQRLLTGLTGEDDANGPVERLTRLLLGRAVLPLGLSVATTAIVASALVALGALLVVLGGWTPLLCRPGALLVLLGGLTARAERRLAALHGRPVAGGRWGSVLRDDALGLLFFAALGVHLSIAATASTADAPPGGISRVSNVYLVLSLLFAVLVAYARYVAYFDTVRRLGGIGALARFTWWFEEGAGARPSTWRALLSRWCRLRWTTAVAIGAVGVLAGLVQVTFLVAVAAAAGVFVLALLHQIHRGDL